MATNVKINIKYDFVKAKKDFNKVVSDIQKQSKGITIKTDSKSIQSTNKALKQTATVSKTVTKEVSQTNSAFMNMGTTMAGNILKMAEWGLGASLLYGNLRRIREGVEFITAVDSAMAEVRMVTRMTKDETDTLVDSYVKMGEELKVSTQAISEASVQLYRQGLATGEVNDRLEDFIKLSKVLGTELSETVEKGTAGVNSLGVDAERLGDVVTAVGASAATSGEEILTIIQLAGATAGATGTSLEQLAALGAVISQQTRLSSRTIGVSLNTILAKFSQIDALTGDVNEDYGKIIDRMNELKIATTDLNGEMLPSFDLIMNIGKAYDSLSKKERAYLTGAIGIRQFNRFASSISQVDENIRLLGVAQQSAGAVAQQYIEYQGTIEAKNEALTVSFEKLAKDTISDELIKSFLELATTSINIVNDFNLIEVAISALGAVIASMIIGKMPLLMTQFVEFTIIAQKFGVQTALVTAGLTKAQIATASFAGVIGVLTFAYLKHIETQKQLLADLGTLSDELSTAFDVSDDADALIMKLELLGETASRTAEQEQEYVDVQNKLKEILPQSKSLIDEKTTSLELQIETFKRLNLEAKEFALQKAEETIYEMTGAWESAIATEEKAIQTREYYSNILDEIQAKRNAGIDLTWEEIEAEDTAITERGIAIAQIEEARIVIDRYNSAQATLAEMTLQSSEATRTLEEDMQLLAMSVFNAQKAMGNKKAEAPDPIVRPRSSSRGIARTKKDNKDILDQYEQLFNQLSDIKHQSTITAEQLNRMSDEEKLSGLLKQNHLYEIQQQKLHEIAQEMRKTQESGGLTEEEMRKLTVEIQKQSEEWHKLESSIHSNEKQMEDISKTIQQDLIDSIKESNEELRKQADIIGDELSDAIKQQIEDIRKLKEARGAELDLDIQAEKDKLQAYKDQNEAIDKQNRLLDMRKSLTEAEQRLANIQKEENVLRYTGGGATGFERVADPQQVEQAQQNIADIKKSIQEEEVKQTRDATIKEFEARVDSLEKQKEAEMKSFDERIARLQDFESKIEDSTSEHNKIQSDMLSELIDAMTQTELDGYDERIDNLKDFVNKYNSTIGGIKSTSNISTSSGGGGGGKKPSSGIYDSKSGLVVPIPSLSQTELDKIRDNVISGGATVGAPFSSSQIPNVAPRQQSEPSITIGELKLPNVKDVKTFAEQLTPKNLISIIKTRS